MSRTLNQPLRDNWFQSCLFSVVLRCIRCLDSDASATTQLTRSHLDETTASPELSYQVNSTPNYS